MIKDAHLKHLLLNSEKTYTGWTRQYQAFVNGNAPNDLATDDVRSQLSYLAAEQIISALTQNQASNAVLLIFRYDGQKRINVLDAVGAKKKRRITVVFSPEEVGQVFNYLNRTNKADGDVDRWLRGAPYVMS